MHTKLQDDSHILTSNLISWILWSCKMPCYLVTRQPSAIFGSSWAWWGYNALVFFVNIRSWASYQIRKIAGCTYAGNAGNVFPATDFKHNDVIKWKHLPRYWPFVREIHWSPVNSPHKGQWLGALMFSLICAWLNDWINNREAGDLRRHRAHYDVTVVK